MKVRVNIDEAVWARASQLTGVADKSELANMGLDSLIASASARRLAALAGTEKALRPTRRRKSN